MFNPYTQFKRLFPKDIRWETAVIVFHICRKTLFNERREMLDTSVSGGTWLLLVCVALNLWVVYRNRQLVAHAVCGTRWFLAYMGFCLLSLFWAINGEAGLSTIVGKGVEILTGYLALAVVLYKIKDVERSVVYVLCLATVSALCGAVAQRFSHTNSYTVSAMMGFVIALGLRRQYNPKHINIFIALNLLCLVAGTSSGSYIASLCALVVLFSTGKRGIRIGYALGVCVVALVLYQYAYDIIYSLVFYGHGESAIESGTGRYEAWEEFLEGWKLSPWLGHGYMVGERNLLLMGGHMEIFSAHNGYLSVLVNTGIIGSALFLAFLVPTLLRGFAKAQVNNLAQPYATIFFAAFCGMLVNNISYPLIGSDWNYTFPPMMAIVIAMNTWGHKVKGPAMRGILTKRVWKQSAT